MISHFERKKEKKSRYLVCDANLMSLTDYFEEVLGCYEYVEEVLGCFDFDDEILDEVNQLSD